MEVPEEVPYRFLREITDGFSEERKVGQGGFGTVYKGVTQNESDVAVKILRDGFCPDLDFKKFQNEFNNLTKVKHNNVVQFLGYCYEIEPTSIGYGGRILTAEVRHRALCFEYLHNGSLQNHLSDESCGLHWHTRYKIIKGTCEGLRYIHEETSLLHLDLKPDNILLDEDMVPKIADFGLSMIFGDRQIRDPQSSFGTLGYKPPEYINNKKISKKFDIFSLGVIIIRIVSGEKGYPKCLRKPDEFIEQVLRNWKKRCQACSNELLLEACYYCRQVETCTQIALECLEEDSLKRPDIVEIMDKLKEIEPDNCKETHTLQPPESEHKTVSGTTGHNEMKLTKELKVLSDHHKHSKLMMIGSSSNEMESDSAQEILLDDGEQLIVGRDKEQKNVMASLLESMKSAKMVILPIYGIGGIGKTTFAKLFYNDTNFKYYSRAWVDVHQRFDVEKIRKSIDSQLSGKENQANEQQISKDILIVLDDLWEDNPVVIEALKKELNLGDSIKGPTVIVLITTRSEDIAKKIRANIEPYKIGTLTDEMCWDIIKQQSCFEAIQDREKLVDIGKKIAKKCRGVALAAQTLGSMLRSMKNYDEWTTVEHSDIWHSEDTPITDHVLASLKLSFVFGMKDDMLKKCFTYCAIFPKGHQIVKHDLMHQWISLDFIKPTKMFSTLQLCERYIVHLLGLTFLQHSVSPTTYPAYRGHDMVLTMHDLVHDLAISLLGDKILDQRKQGNTMDSSCSYALLVDSSKPLELGMVYPAQLSALRFVDCQTTELHGSALEPAESLRVLDLSECSIPKLPDSIGQLKQLRYLNAPRIRDQMVAECITKLSNLRYLNLRESCAILALPKSIGEMKGLVHLDLSGCIEIGNLPESFGDLTSLEHVDFTNCKNVTGVSQCLARLTKLQHLNLSSCQNIGGIPVALGCLTELQYLNLSGSSYLSGNKLSEVEFLGSLTKLKYLNLSSVSSLCRIKLPESLGSLTELKYLNISGHTTMQKLPASFGNLCNLVHLDLSLCYRLQDVQAALNGLTKLQYLNLYKCTGFETIAGREVFGSLTELRHLNISYCNALRSPTNPDKINGRLRQICTLTNLQYLDLSNNDGIYSIPETLSNLGKLHTLDLSSCIKLKTLPASISEIDSLKFLYTRGCGKLDRSTLPQHNTSDGESSNYSFQLDYETSAQLKISRLENVQLAKEAKKLKLREKINITRLTIEWTRDAKRFVDDVEVLRQLEAPYSVSEFLLKGYNSVSFPDWVMNIRTFLPGLTSIVMSDLPKCNNLPPLGQLPNLERLVIKRMCSIEKMDLDGGSKAFPRLECLFIDDMERLEEWNMAYSSDEDSLNVPAFPCLRCVEISKCPRLLRFKPRPPPSYTELPVDTSDKVLSSSWLNTVLKHMEDLDVQYRGMEYFVVKPIKLTHPGLEVSVTNCNLKCSWPDFFRGLSSLRRLTVTGWESFASLERLGDITSLTGLHIFKCKSIQTLPESLQQLTHLQFLTVDHCNSISSLDTIQQLTLLRTLTVKSCESIVSLPDRLGDLTSLMELKICHCKAIKSLSDNIQQLTCLQTLTIEHCQSIVSLPERLGELTSLTKLEIRHCIAIKTLPDSMQQLTNLQTLTIEHCQSIMSLPESLEGLTSLMKLEIRYCKAIKTLSDNIQQLTCLQDLTIEHCQSIVSLPERLGELTSLTKLEIRHCMAIKTLPDMQQLTCLQTLTIEHCQSIMSLPERLEGLTSLTKLEIRDCMAIKTLPDSMQQLTCLQTLIIEHCQSIMSLPERLEGLNSLMKLEIRYCRAIKTLSDNIQQLTCLQTLTIEHCQSIMSLPERLGELTSLTKLHIRWCAAFKRLPNSIQELTNLQTLMVTHCESIVSLPERLGELTSLRTLHLTGCRGIIALPNSIQQLTCLQIWILECPGIVKWCKSEENKMKVAHLNILY